MPKGCEVWALAEVLAGLLLSTDGDKMRTLLCWAPERARLTVQESSGMFSPHLSLSQVCRVALRCEPERLEVQQRGWTGFAVRRKMLPGC